MKRTTKADCWLVTNVTTLEEELTEDETAVMIKTGLNLETMTKLTSFVRTREKKIKHLIS